MALCSLGSRAVLSAREAGILGQGHFAVFERRHTINVEFLSNSLDLAHPGRMRCETVDVATVKALAGFNELQVLIGLLPMLNRLFLAIDVSKLSLVVV